MSTTSSLTTADGFRLSHRASVHSEPNRPLLVCLPGGSYNSAYFDLPGYSLLDAAAQAGCNVIAFDRPNYGSSDPLPGDQTTFAQNARVLAADIEEAWAELGPDSPGVVLIGHSIGVHFAASEDSTRSSQLIGLAFSGVNQKSPDHVVAAWQSVPACVPVVLSPEQRRMFIYGPDGSFDPEVLDTAEAAGEAAPLAELLEIVDGWLTDYPKLAPLVRVPVHYTLAEFDQLWLCSQDRVDAFVDQLTRAPFVERHYWLRAGHNIEHHHVRGVPQEPAGLRAALREPRVVGSFRRARAP